MTDVATEPEREAPGGELAVPRHDPEIGERVRKLADEEAARAEAEDETTDDEQGSGDEREDESESQADEPSGSADAPRVSKLPKVPPDDPRTDTCPICRGHGVVLTGSGVEGQEDRRCWRCQGAGYLELRPNPEDEPREDSRWIAPTNSPY